MRYETKRLADISIEQFKIKSYPTFLVETEKPSVKSNELIQKYKIHNKGELTAFKVTSFLMNVYKNDEGGHDFFALDTTAYWVGEERQNTINFERKILRDTTEIIENIQLQSKIERLERLLYVLLFIRFEVPYDDKFSYEIYGYTLKEKQKVWQPMANKTTKNLVRNFKGYFKGLPKRLEDFFKDYRID